MSKALKLAEKEEALYDKVRKRKLLSDEKKDRSMEETSPPERFRTGVFIAIVDNIASQLNKRRENLSKIKDMYAYIKSNGLENTFPNLEVALRIFLTLTNCTAEQGRMGITGMLHTFPPEASRNLTATGCQSGTRRVHKWWIMGRLSKRIRIICKGKLRDIKSKVPPEPKLAFQTKSKCTVIGVMVGLVRGGGGVVSWQGYKKGRNSSLCLGRWQGGETGPAGKPGSDGAPGPQGVQGNPGPPGPLGEQGPEGPSGKMGPPGISGRPGDKGPVGIPGNPGPPGAPGLMGPPGSSVPPVPAGERGQRGETGPQRVEGPVGQRGKPGPPGPEGARGERGEVGAKGVKGHRGLNGLQGLPGLQVRDAFNYLPSIITFQHPQR
ncbi:hypothetical protein J6590_097379 [Homalodisca vitripennis]|nr:hypothetical protein J6590_097379 [Homalodisca vitripennis]